MTETFAGQKNIKEMAMKRSKGMLVIAILTVAVGVGLLLNAMNLLPPIDWLWTIGLFAAGVLMMGLRGIDKLTGVIGPFLIFSALCSVLRQMDILPFKYEIPLLVIVLGCLLFLAEVLDLPAPRAMQNSPEDQKK
jgi:hypothetical protein